MTEKCENWTFGELDGTLSRIHQIADNKRTAFQSRLKNFHRLGFPPGFKSEKGKASLYSADQVVQMALAIEMAQLGLSPDRTTMILSRNWFAVMMAMKLAAKAICQEPDGFHWPDSGVYDGPESMFLYFDVNALQELSLGVDPKIAPDLDKMVTSFEYGDIEVVRHNIPLWTSYDASRISLINITGLLFQLSKMYHDTKQRLEFFYEIIEWAESIPVDRLKQASKEYLFEFLDGYHSGDDSMDRVAYLVSWQLKIEFEWVREAVIEHGKAQARYERAREDHDGDS